MGVRKRRRVPWGWIWSLVLLAAVAGYGLWYRQTVLLEGGKLPVGVQTGKAVRGTIDQKITATGVAAAQVGAKVNIGSQISGRVRSLPADVGTVVQAGQVVAVLDSPDLQAQVEQQRQSVSVAEASVEQAESRLRQAMLTAEMTRQQTKAQIDEGGFAVQGADERLQVAEAAKQLQPTQTATEIARAQAALSTAKSLERQAQQTVALQLLQAQTTADEARASFENGSRLLKRQQSLLAQGYIARQEVDDTRTAYVQASARLKSAEANQSIVKEKTEADLQAAGDRVAEAEATLEAARAGRLQDRMREAEERSARQAKRQAEATLTLRRTAKTQDVIRLRAVEEARSAVAQSRANLQQARALLRYQQAQLDKAVIRSPIRGTVLSISAPQGETVAAGFSAPTLITVADLDRLEIRAYVDEVDVGKARLGLPAEVRVESYPSRVFHGHVTKIASSSTMKDNVVTYETTIAISDAGGLLRPDMTADVTLILGRTPNVLMVPTESVHRAVGRSVVYLLHREKKGKERVEERTVGTGLQDNSSTQIVTGLKEGEEVVMAGLQRLGVKALDAQNAEGKKEK